MKKIPFYIKVPIVIALFMFLFEFFIDSGDRPAFVKYPIVVLLVLSSVLLLFSVEIIMLSIGKILFKRGRLDFSKNKRITESLDIFAETNNVRLNLIEENDLN